METYSLLREFADSWMLLVLFTFFVGVFVWVIRPGSNSAHAQAKTVILRNEDRPAAAKEARS
ncbi:cbb3-type cytochrome c oxidase subunit 3 [Primorskyibacter sp. S187A]|uniref:cbb3-type cytochrome c oxidase subunit 3 n=1 Tax=Primorskyibacter sp. S187A TaxID=3415130 RepID=UPI003C7E2174